MLFSIGDINIDEFVNYQRDNTDTKKSLIIQCGGGGNNVIIIIIASAQPPPPAWEWMKKSIHPSHKENSLWNSLSHGKRRRRFWENFPRGRFGLATAAAAAKNDPRLHKTWPSVKGKKGLLLLCFAREKERKLFSFFLSSHARKKTLLLLYFSVSCFRVVYMYILAHSLCSSWKKKEGRQLSRLNVRSSAGILNSQPRGGKNGGKSNRAYWGERLDIPYIRYVCTSLRKDGDSFILHTTHDVKYRQTLSLSLSLSFMFEENDGVKNESTFVLLHSFFPLRLLVSFHMIHVVCPPLGNCIINPISVQDACCSRKREKEKLLFAFCTYKHGRQYLRTYVHRLIPYLYELLEVALSIHSFFFLSCLFLSLSLSFILSGEMLNSVG